MSNSIFVQDRVTHKIPLEQRIDYIKNPLLAVEAIFGFELAYFQITCLNESWFKSSFMDCSGYGTGKTFRIALLMALRAILLPNRVQMIISHTYGGVKLVFDTYLEPWFHEIPGYRAHFADDIKSPVSKTSDLYSVKLANGNEIRGVPPAIMTGSTRLRSERCNDIYLDEFAHYHSQEEIDTVIKSKLEEINFFEFSLVRRVPFVTIPTINPFFFAYLIMGSVLLLIRGSPPVKYKYGLNQATLSTTFLSCSKLSPPEIFLSLKIPDFP